MSWPSAKQPNEIFTPRATAITTMYVDRPELEERLSTALAGTLHVLVHGESGTGKSWLYKKVLASLGAESIVANLANAKRLGSISAEFKNNIDRKQDATKTSYSETTDARVKAVFAEGGLEHEGQFKIGEKEPFEALMSMLRKSAGKRPAVLVLDNLESIIDSPQLMDELASLIILLDDERYAEYRVKMLIVGVPARVRDYYNRTPARAPVANRLTEIPEVSRLSEVQARELINRGFISELAYETSQGDLTHITKHVTWVTDRIPQHLHEYCLELGLIGLKAGRRLEVGMLHVADGRWLQSNLSNAYSTIENMMNERETRLGRRNQLLYVIGSLDSDELRLPEVEATVRSEFPTSTEGKGLNISGGLSDLASGDSPVLRRSPKGDSWAFADPRFRMCIRAMLEKDPSGESVAKRPIGSLL